MPNNILQFNEEIIKGQMKDLVRGSVEETLNGLLGGRNTGLQIGQNFIRTPSQSKNEKGKIPNFLRINDLCLFLCLHTFTRIKLHKNTQQISLKKRK